MIFISSACVSNDKIKDSVLELAKNGFKNIELSGGTNYYDLILDDLIQIKNKYKLNFICHNYFPPPAEHFVLNLASLDDDIFLKTYNQLEKAIKLTQKLNVDKFGFHAGFYFNIPLNEIGKKISKHSLFDREKSINRFCKAFKKLKKTNHNINLYLENNVISSENFKNFGENFFMLTNAKEYIELKKLIDFQLILDVAHLKVSCKTLNLNFQNELDYLIQQSNYIHISDNNALADQNKSITKNSELYGLLSKYSFKNKIVTIEVYEEINKVINSYNLINKL